MVSLPDPYYNDDPKSFAYPTVHKRWPTIIEGCIKDVKSEISANPDFKDSGEGIIKKLQQLLISFKNDEPVRKFTQSEIIINSDLKFYNDSWEALSEKKKITWLTGPWLYLECYLYQLINLYFISSENEFWTKFDVFEGLKNNTFKQSELGVLELCKRYEVLNKEVNEKGIDPKTLELLFAEFIDISLWGNATDLSLLAGNVTLEDIKSLQGAEVRKKNEENILVNDLPQAWEHLLNNPKLNRRIDIVLDNSGFELFADLVFGLFSLDSGLIQTLHLHCKEIPWFVSDTMPKDFHALLDQLFDSSFYPTIYSNEEDKKSIQFFHSRLNHYYKNNQIVVESNKFWTLDCNYWNIPKFDDLYKSLLKSDLVIFKGDLNYRKLTGDLQWEKTTPFTTAIQDLAMSKIPVLSLRTCKADVVVGLPEGVNESLIEKYKSMGNEVGEFWSSSGKWAVISFSSGK